MAIPPDEWENSPFNLENPENNNPPKNDPEPDPQPQPEKPKSITPHDIRLDLDRFKQQARDTGCRLGMFTLKTAEQWMLDAGKRPVPKMLFDRFWLEGELCILFADTNLGKSILAVQIANSLSKGEAIPGFKLEAQAQPVLYFDFELSDKQFEGRYSKDYTNYYPFNQNFIRVEINPDAEIPEGVGFEEYIAHSVEEAIIMTGAKTAIVDNLTYLRRETEKAKDAQPLMKELKALKTRHNLSMLVLAHTPKRDLSKEVTHNDLQGSKSLSIFSDNLFCIGSSCQDKSMRYIKQLKARSTELTYDAENVCLCNIIKPDNFLRFNFLQYAREQEHLKQIKDEDRTKLELRVRELLEAEPELGPFAVAKRLGTDEPNFNSFQVRVNRIFKKVKCEH